MRYKKQKARFHTRIERAIVNQDYNDFRRCVKKLTKSVQIKSSTALQMFNALDCIDELIARYINYPFFQRLKSDKTVSCECVHCVQENLTIKSLI